MLQAFRDLREGPDPGEEIEILWLGGEGGMEADMVARAGISFAALPAAGLHGVGLLNVPGNLWKLLQGFWRARRILRDYKPDALFFTGGYVSVPAGLAGRKLPTLVYVPDIEPGLALQLVSRFADRIAVTTSIGLQYFKKAVDQVTVTGYPVRADLTRRDKAEALRHFTLSKELPTLLVFGGSQGARSINRALLASLDTLLAEMQIIHISGDANWTEVAKVSNSLPAALGTRYRPFPYLYDDMGAAMAAADLVVSRAGASALGEFPLFALPAILVPYPYAWRYQQNNAGYLVERGGALLVRDEELQDMLVDTILDLMRDSHRRHTMASAMRKLAVPDAAHKIAKILQEMTLVRSDHD